ncbi:MAG: cell division protein ZapA [Elusimicrobiota bacterium]
MSKNKPETTKIEICNREYNIASDEWQPLYIKKLAEILQNEVEEIESAGVVDSYKILVFSALRIIDRMLDLKDQKTGNNKYIEEELKDLNSQIEEVI